MKLHSKFGSQIDDLFFITNKMMHITYILVTLLYEQMSTFFY